MTAKAQELNAQRWTQVISLRPAPILFFYRAAVLTLAVWAVAGWHLAVLSLTCFILFSRRASLAVFSAPQLSEHKTATNLPIASSSNTYSSTDFHGYPRLYCSPQRWLWRLGSQSIYYQVEQAYRGPFWYYVVLRDAQGRRRKLSLWRFTMSTTAWRRLSVLLQAKRWQQLT